MIHYKPTPYFEKLGFGFKGTSAQPITIQGVRWVFFRFPIVRGYGWVDVSGDLVTMLTSFLVMVIFLRS